MFESTSVRLGPHPIADKNVAAARVTTIPPRFMKHVNTHLLGNLLDVADYPLIMWIVGRPGMGKTWQLRRHLELLGFSVSSVSAADLESKEAGEPAKLIQRRYLEAGRSLAQGSSAALVVDDIDTTLGEWENHTGTVNHHGILAFLMHIADRPSHIESVGKVRRVPVFFTGNDASRLYAPLARHGRMVRFNWEPTRDERISIVSSILGFGPGERRAVGELVDMHPESPISFFSHLVTARAVEVVAEKASGATFAALLQGDDHHIQALRHEIDAQRMVTDWSQVATQFHNESAPDAS